MKDTIFYDQESTRYSSKRYPKKAENYTQFFFNRRLSIVKRLITKALKGMSGEMSLLELGCADGIVVRSLEETFPERFFKLIGIDISPGMVKEAQEQNQNPRAEFLLRSAYLNQPQVDIINETGVINYAGFDGDIEFVRQNLASGGVYIISIAGTDSLLNRLKPMQDFKDFRSYKEYEALLKKYFIVEKEIGCGLFLPHLWKLPLFARIVQKLVDPIAGFLVPNLCHEKVYLLRIK